MRRPAFSWCSAAPGASSFRSFVQKHGGAESRGPPRHEEIGQSRQPNGVPRTGRLNFGLLAQARSGGSPRGRGVTWGPFSRAATLPVAHFPPAPHDRRRPLPPAAEAGRLRGPRAARHPPPLPGQPLTSRRGLPRAGGRVAAAAAPPEPR